MSAAMGRIRREAIARYGDAPATPEEALAHVLTVHADEPDERLMIEATNGIYGDGVHTGLTMGDLRTLATYLEDDEADDDPHEDCYGAHRGPDEYQDCDGNPI